MSTVSFVNYVLGRCVLTTEHAASSYGIPVLVTADGRAFGRGDSIPSSGFEVLDLMCPDTVGELVANVIAPIEAYEGKPGSEFDQEKLDMARRFLGR